MARRKVTYTVPGVRSEEPGQRDNGKSFLITEMPADQGERWATQAIYLLAQAGANVPLGAADAGMAGLAATGVAFTAVAIAHALQDPSLDALWDCVQFQPKDPNIPPQAIQSGINSQIEEISTRTKLRMEVMALHTAFFTDAKSRTPAASQSRPTSSSTYTCRA